MDSRKNAMMQGSFSTIRVVQIMTFRSKLQPFASRSLEEKLRFLGSNANCKPKEIIVTHSEKTLMLPVLRFRNLKRNASEIKLRLIGSEK